MKGRKKKELAIVVRVAPGLGEVAAAELRELGIAEPDEIGERSVWLRGDLRAAYRANLELATASRVLVEVGRAKVGSFEALREKCASIDWSPWLRGGPLEVRAHATRTRMKHTGAIAERVRAGSARALGAELVEGEGQRVEVRMHGDRATLYVDTSGAALHRRGYRLQTAKAPLREDLAAALVRSAWDGRGRLVDPLMGSGTIAIEAALFAGRIPPGRGRTFAFEQMPGANIGLWASVKENAKQAMREAAPVFGSDRDAGALEAAKANAERAGVELALAEAALGNAPGFEGDVGAMVTNPPWGERVSASDDLRPLYQSLAARVPAAWRIGVVSRSAKLLAPLGTKPLLTTMAGGKRVGFHVR